MGDGQLARVPRRAEEIAARLVSAPVGDQHPGAGFYRQVLRESVGLLDCIDKVRQEMQRQAREACGIAPSAVVGELGARAGLYESAIVRVHPTGSITVFTGSHSHGQGHETTFAQVVADRLGVPADQVEIVHGDTARCAFGMGTYGSRSIAVGGTAIIKAMEKIESKAKKIAAHALEASENDIVIENGGNRFNRPLYGSNTAFFVYSGDLPELVGLQAGWRRASDSLRQSSVALRAYRGRTICPGNQPVGSGARTRRKKERTP